MKSVLIHEIIARQRNNKTNPLNKNLDAYARRMDTAVRHPKYSYTLLTLQFSSMVRRRVRRRADRLASMLIGMRTFVSKTTIMHLAEGADKYLSRSPLDYPWRAESVAGGF